MKNNPVKSISREKGRVLGIDQFPNFSKSGSISGMRKLYYGPNARLVRCGLFIYKVTEEFYQLHAH